MSLILLYRRDHEVLRYPVTSPVVRIGRHPTNDLALPDEEISRFHAVIEEREGGYWIADQSRNGTIVNGRRIQRSPLSFGDQVVLGHWRFVFTDDIGWDDRETVVHSRPSGRTLRADSFQGLIGVSAVMSQVFEKIAKSAPTMATVLILGETGSGKELAARAVHELSPRSHRPFVAINCGAISPQLIESELFGHERGAFTGAVGRHVGAFEQAQGGTIFLDEVGELPLELQPKLLRVLEERRFRRVGGHLELDADVRMVAATHRQLEMMVRQGRFREDLYFRLFTIPIVIPPLRERKEDIPLIAQYFLEALQARGGERKSWSDAALERLKNHPWKGNVRELRNVITRSLLFAPGELIFAEDLLFYSDETPVETPLLADMEKRAILNALKENGWHKRLAAEDLGIARSTLFEKMKEYGIKKE